jgi:hypothetical protein
MSADFHAPFVGDYSGYLVQCRKELSTIEACAALHDWEYAINATVKLSDTVNLLGAALMQHLAREKQIQLALSEPDPTP